MRSITATRTIGLALALVAIPVPVAAGDAVERVLAAARLAPGGYVVEDDEVRRACGGAGLCAASYVVAALGPDARLARVRHPDTDTIRWARTPVSVVAHAGVDGKTRIEIRRFGRKVMRELEAALAGATTGALILDLRRNRGGDFERMLEVAGRLVGSTPKAFRVRDAEGARWSDLEAGGTEAPRVDRVLIGTETASAAEVLAALLAAHTGARLCGIGRTRGKDFVQAVLPVAHDWRLLLRRADVEVPGIELAGGLAPDPGC